MTILDDLYYGNIHPCERNVTPSMRQLQIYSCRHDEALTATLTEKQKETFIKFKDCQDELLCLCEREMFRYGFALATRLMVDAMNELDPNLDA